MFQIFKITYILLGQMNIIGILIIASEKVMAPDSSTLAWKIPWTEEPGGLQSMGSLRVRQDWATSLSLFTFMHWRRNGNPLQCSCLENPRDGGAWWAAVYGVAQSRTRLKRLSSSSSNHCIFFIRNFLKSCFVLGPCQILQKDFIRPILTASKIRNLSHFIFSDNRFWN